MSRTGVLLAFLASSVIFVFGASAPSQASAAANCNFTATTVSWTGYLTYTHWASGCTDVDLVEWSPKYLGTGVIVVGLIDVSTGGTLHHVSVPPSWANALCGRQYVTYTDSCGWAGYVNPWCPPQTAHVVYSTAQVRIHRKSTQTWGSWHGRASTNQSIWC